MNSNYHNVLDIETYDDNGVFVPYCICVIIKEKEIIFYKKKEEDIIEDLIYFFEKENLKETIYVHNLTFDGIIIIESISKKKKIKFKAILFKSNIYELEI